MNELEILGGNSQSRPAGSVPRVISIHTGEGSTTPAPPSARNIAGWIASGGGPDKVSAHYAVDAETAVRCVPDNRIAYTQGGWQYRLPILSIEQGGAAAYTAERWAQADARSMIENVAQICARWCARYGIPAIALSPQDLADPNATGICRHRDFSAAYALDPSLPKSDHSDPGTAYPFDALIARVNEILHPTPTPPPAPTEEDDTMALLRRIKPFAGIASIAPGSHLTPEENEALQAGRTTGLIESGFHALAVRGMLFHAGEQGSHLVGREAVTQDHVNQLAEVGVTGVKLYTPAP
jgi:hypothetical protein